MPIETSGISYFLPLISFLLVLVVSFVVMNKLKIPENKVFQVLIAFLLAALFVSVGGVRAYIENIVPWFAVVLIAFFLMLLIFALAGKSLEDWSSPVAKIFIVVLFVIFIIAGLFVFSSSIAPYLPWSSSFESTQASSFFTDWLYNPRVGGAVLLLIVSALVAWILIKVK